MQLPGLEIWIEVGKHFMKGWVLDGIQMLFFSFIVSARKLSDFMK